MNSNIKPLPWIKFVTKDWKNDGALRQVGIAARGLWIDMVCIMHESEPYGHLIASGVVVTPQGLARLVGEPLEVVETLLAELERCRVFSRTKDGVIFSRRLLRDRQAHIEAQANGKMGGNPRLKEEAAARKARKIADYEEGVNPTANPRPTAPIKLEKEIDREERVLATLVPAEPPAKADMSGQASFLGDDPPRPSKPLTPFKRMQRECLPVLAKIKKKDLDNDAHRLSLCKLLGEIYDGAGKDAERVMSAFSGLRLEDDDDRVNAIGTIKEALKKQANGSDKPRLVVSNTDPDDAWGILGYCKASTTMRPATQADCSGPLNSGKWLCHGRFFDKIAVHVALAARLPATFRVDWSPLEFWLSHGLQQPDIVHKITKRVEWIASKGNYEPGSLSRFTSAVMEGVAAA